MSPARVRFQRTQGIAQRRRLLAAYDAFLIQRRYAPTLRDLAEQTGMAVSTTAFHVARLIQDGYFTRAGGARTLLRTDKS